MKATITIFACVFLLLASRSYGNECGHVDFLMGFEKNNDVEHRGYYFHPGYCFSVIIPEGVVGRTSSQPSSQHGFGAILSKDEGGTYLLVQGDYGAWLDNDDTPRSLEKIARRRLEWLTEDKAIIVQKEPISMQFGGLPAKRLVVSYKCPQSRYTFIFDSIFALNNEGTIFEITLWGTEASYNQTRPILEKVASSWKIENEKCREKFQKQGR